MNKKIEDRIKTFLQSVEEVPVSCTGCGKKSLLMMSRVRTADTTFECEECASKREIEKQRLERLRLWEKICPPLYRNTEPKRLSSKLIDKVKSWTYSSTGLAFMGTSGVGKTRAMWTLLARLHMDGYDVMAIDSAEFTRGVATRYSESPSQAVAWIESMIDADIFFIDDFGKGKLTERVESELFGIVEGRVKNLRPIMFTSNLDAGGLRNQMSSDRSEPLIRRLIEFCEVVEL